MSSIRARSVTFACICGGTLLADIGECANTCPSCERHIRVQESKKMGRLGTAVFISVIKYKPRHRVIHSLGGRY